MLGAWMGSLVASPLSDRSKELKALASQTKSCITWAPTERSWRWREIRCTQDIYV